jgi:hypothetical protein
MGRGFEVAVLAANDDVFYDHMQQLIEGGK